MDDRDVRTAFATMVQHQPAQPSVWEDVERGRLMVRRRRVRLGSVTGAVLVAAAVGWVTIVPGAALGRDGFDSGISGTPNAAEILVPETYVAPDWEPAAEYQPEELTDEEAIARCNTYVHNDGSTFQGDAVDNPQGFPIYAGDMITILRSGETEISADGFVTPVGGWCQVPGTWTEQEQAAGPMSADDTDEILVACSNTSGVDLTDWVVAASMSDGYGGISASLVSPGQQYRTECVLGPDRSSAWIRHHGDDYGDTLPEERAQLPFYEGLIGTAVDTTCYPSEELCAGQVHASAGVLPAGLERIVATTADGTEIEIPVGVHGTYAIQFVVPLDDPGPVLTVFDGAGVAKYETTLST